MSTRSRPKPLVVVVILILSCIGAVLWWTSRASTGATLRPDPERVFDPAADVHANALSKAGRDVEHPQSPVETRSAGVKPATEKPATRDEGVVVSGRCIDASGHALEHVHIELLGLRRSADGGILPLEKTYSADSGPTGRFELRFTPRETKDTAKILSAGIEGRLAGYSALLAEIEPATPRRFDAGDVVLVRGVALSGSVHDSAGESEPDAMVQVMRAGVRGSLQKHPDQSVTKPDGTFAIADAAPGNIRVSAKTTDGRESPSLELSLGPAESKSDIDLVVPLFDDPLAVTGIVLDASDRPLDKVKVAFTAKMENGSSSDERSTDARGRFRIQVRAGAILRLRAVSPDPALGATIVNDVVPGTHGLHVVLRAARLVTLHVHDAAGNPVVRFGWTSSEIDPIRASVVEKQAEADHAGGDARIRADGDPLSIVVTASGYESTTVGPFALSSIGGTIDVSLRRMPAIHGVVVENDEPVHGANVTMLETFARNESHTDGPFDLVFLRCTDCPSTTTDEQGRFTLPAPKIGRFVVRAAPASRPPAISGELTIAPDGPDVDVRVEVRKGGAIEGPVQRTGGAGEADWIVVASSGDGSPRRTKSDANGRYRFDGLAPGGWQLRARPEQGSLDLLGNGSEVFSGRDAPPIRWDCTVSSGEITHYDIVLPASSTLVVELGSPFDAGKWTPNVLLRCPSLGIDRERNLKPDGPRWTIDLECTGQADLSVIGSRDGCSWNYSGPVKIEAGRNDFRLALDSGDVEGRVPDAKSGMRVLIMWQRASDGWRTNARVNVGKDGRFELLHAPAGECTLRVEGADKIREDKVTVPAGQRIDVGDL